MPVFGKLGSHVQFREKKKKLKMGEKSELWLIAIGAWRLRKAPLAARPGPGRSLRASQGGTHPRMRFSDVPPHPVLRVFSFFLWFRVTFFLTLV